MLAPEHRATCSFDMPVEWTRGNIDAPGISQIDSHSAGIDLFLVDLLAYPWEQDESCLSLEERTRASRFRFEQDRNRYSATHCALRKLLARTLKCSPTALHFQTGRFGKPRLAEAVHPNHEFNLSQSKDLALLGIANELPVGVDIEAVTRIENLMPLVSNVFTSDEIAELLHTSANQRTSAFLRGWTRKEACLKAAGCGLTVAPSEVHVGLAGNTQTVRFQAGHRHVRACVSTIDVGPAAVAAVAWIEGMSV